MFCYFLSGGLNIIDCGTKGDVSCIFLANVESLHYIILYCTVYKTYHAVTYQSYIHYEQI